MPLSRSASTWAVALVACALAGCATGSHGRHAKSAAACRDAPCTTRLPGLPDGFEWTRAARKGDLFILVGHRGDAWQILGVTVAEHRVRWRRSLRVEMPTQIFDMKVRIHENMSRGVLVAFSNWKGTSTLVALGPDGRLQWKKETGPFLGVAGEVKRVIYIVEGRRLIRGLALETGRERWRYAAKEALSDLYLSVDRSRVYTTLAGATLGGRHTLRYLVVPLASPSSARKAWLDYKGLAREGLHPPPPPLTLRITETEDGKADLVTAKSGGKILWSRSRGMTAGRTELLGDTVIMQEAAPKGDDDLVVTARRASDGRLRWTFRLPKKLYLSDAERFCGNTILSLSLPGLSSGELIYSVNAWGKPLNHAAVPETVDFWLIDAGNLVWLKGSTLNTQKVVPCASP